MSIADQAERKVTDGIESNVTQQRIGNLDG